MENIVEFLENIEINDYTFKLEKSKQLLLSPIYSLGLKKLENLKTYIKTIYPAF